MSDDWHLEMTFRGPYGEKYTVAMPVDSHVAVERFHVKKPLGFGLMLDTGVVLAGAFEQVVYAMKRREYRKTAFIDAAAKMGQILAERMEDKEGWHGIEREEKLETWGRS